MRLTSGLESGSVVRPLRGSCALTGRGVVASEERVPAGTRHCLVRSPGLCVPPRFPDHAGGLGAQELPPAGVGVPDRGGWDATASNLRLGCVSPACGSVPGGVVVLRRGAAGTVVTAAVVHGGRPVRCA